VKHAGKKEKGNSIIPSPQLIVSEANDVHAAILSLGEVIFSFLLAILSLG
jgi:hypothetical protein